MSTTGMTARTTQAAWLWVVWGVLVGVWTLALLTTYPVQVKQQVLPAEAGFPAAKSLHVGAYALLAGLTTFLPLRRGVSWLPVAFLSFHGFATEYCQTYVPMRCGSWTDVGVDHLGILLGLLLTRPWRRWWL